MPLFHRGRPSGPSTLELAPELHVNPRSDMLNGPAEVGSFLAVAGYDTAMASPFWRWEPNTVADAGGNTTGLMQHTDQQIPIDAAQAVSGPFIRSPNSSAQQPAPIRASVMAAHFEAYLKAVQDRLIGAP